MSSVRERINELHARLNHAEVVPRGAYKRNSFEYPLVSYVNHIVALLAADNLEPVSVFIMRAHYARIDLNARGNNEYLDVVAEYLPLVVSYLKERGFTEDDLRPYLPDGFPSVPA